MAAKPGPRLHLKPNPAKSRLSLACLKQPPWLRREKRLSMHFQVGLLAQPSDGWKCSRQHSRPTLAYFVGRIF